MGPILFNVVITDFGLLSKQGALRNYANDNCIANVSKSLTKITQCNGKRRSCVKIIKISKRFLPTSTRTEDLANTIEESFNIQDKIMKSGENLKLLTIQLG